VIKRKMKIKNKLVALVEIVIVLCPVFLMTLSVIAAEQKFHKHSSIFSAPLLLLLNEWFESHHAFYLWRRLLAFISFKCYARNEEEEGDSCGD